MTSRGLQSALDRERMCSLERRGTVYVLKLLGDNEHWLGPQLLPQLLSAINRVGSCREATALVTTSEGKFFSNGLDLPWMSQDPELQSQRSASLLSQLNQVTLALLRLNVPTVAAVCGHAAAGGLLLAMAHDHRFMRRDRGFLYCSAVDIGFVIPSSSMKLLRAKLGPREFKDVVLKGVKYTAASALEAGLVDSAHETAQATFAAAMDEAVSLSKRRWNRDAYCTLRLAMYEDAIAELQEEQNGGHPQRAGFL